MMRGLDKYDHNGGLYLQEGVLIVGVCITEGTRQINPPIKNTIVAYNSYFRSDKYGCKTSSGPWPIPAYHLPNTFLGEWDAA